MNNVRVKNDNDVDFSKTFSADFCEEQELEDEIAVEVYSNDIAPGLDCLIFEVEDEE